jgi:hypothetical protein
MIIEKLEKKTFEQEKKIKNFFEWEIKIQEI